MGSTGRLSPRTGAIPYARNAVPAEREAANSFSVKVAAQGPKMHTHQVERTIVVLLLPRTHQLAQLPRRGRRKRLGEPVFPGGKAAKASKSVRLIHQSRPLLVAGR
jgi:hypothetical protein